MVASDVGHALFAALEQERELAVAERLNVLILALIEADNPRAFQEILDEPTQRIDMIGPEQH